MLFVIFVILVVVGILLLTFGCNSCRDWMENLGIGSAIIGVICTVISLIILACNYIDIDGYVEQMNARYDMLTYQYENDIYENDNDVGKRELMEDIQNWNEDLARLRVNQDDFWIGIYRPNIYDQFEFIELGGPVNE